jgi:hypothetical protein
MPYSTAVLVHTARACLTMCSSPEGPAHTRRAAGMEDAQPVHLLLALARMEPLPTLLHNPLTFLCKPTVRMDVFLAEVRVYSLGACRWTCVLWYQATCMPACHGP